MNECLFCRIVEKEDPSHQIWEDERHLAFLSVFPNTEGTTVVIPKEHYPSYAFDLPDAVLTELILTTKRVAKLLDKKLSDVGRTAIVFEGFGVNHVHSKLFPMHGTTDLDDWKPIHSDIDKYCEKYEGYISSHNGPRAKDKELTALAERIRET